MYLQKAVLIGAYALETLETHMLSILKMMLNKELEIKHYMIPKQRRYF